MKIKFAFLFLLISFFAAAQDPVKLIDSLKTELAKNPADEQKAKIYADLTWYSAFVSTDSAMVYGEKAIELAKKLEDSVLLAQALNDYGTVNFVRGEYNESNAKFRQALMLRKLLKDTVGQAALYSKMGNNFYRKAQFDSTMMYYDKGLRIFEEKGVVRDAAILRSNIASLFMEMKDYKKALEYNEECIAFFRKNGLVEPEANSIINKGIAYLFLKDTATAEQNFEKAVALATDINASKPLGAAYNNLSNIYAWRGDYKEAKVAIQRSIEERQKLGMLSLVESSRISLAEIEIGLGNYNTAYDILLNAKKRINAQEYNEKMPNIYAGLIQVHAAKRAVDSTSYYITKLNTIYTEKSERQIQEVTAELDAKYESEKKENQILEQRAELAEKELQVKRKNAFIYGGFGLAVILGLIGYLLYNQQKLKNRQLKKENELKIALAKIETQNRLQEQRLRISRDLHDNIGSQLTFIISSIDNLKFALGDADDKITNRLTSISAFTATTINELRDTIWAMNKESISVEDLQNRISNYIERAQSSAQEVDFKFTVGHGINKELMLTSVEGINLFRIIQEAVNNAIKYANPQHIIIAFERVEQTLKVTITDDGEGFDLENYLPGNGIRNMKKRASEINATVDVISKKENGTSIIFKNDNVLR